MIARRGHRPAPRFTALPHREAELERRRAELYAELGRVDAKASILLALAGAGLTVVLDGLQRPGLPGPALGGLGVAAALMTAAVVWLLAAVRPGRAPREDDAQAGDAADTARLAALTDRKYQHVRHAVHALFGAVAALAAATPLALFA